MTTSDLVLCGLIVAVLLLLWRRDLVVEEGCKSAIREQKRTNELLADLIACFVPAETSERPEARSASNAVQQSVEQLLEPQDSTQEHP